MKRLFLSIFIVFVSAFISFAGNGPVRKNYVSGALGLNYGSITDQNFAINLEYGRRISERFEAGIFFSKELLEVSTCGIGYHGNYLSGIAYYTLPVFSNISLRFGAGLGLGYFRQERSRHHEPEDKFIPYLHLSGHWVIRMHERWDLVMPLLLFIGPGNFMISPFSPFSASEIISINCDFCTPVTLTFRF